MLAPRKGTQVVHYTMVHFLLQVPNDPLPPTEVCSYKPVAMSTRTMVCLRRRSDGSSLYGAALHDDAELVLLSKQRGADVNFVNSAFGVPPLALAARHHSLEAFRALLGAGADPRAACDPITLAAVVESASEASVPILTALAPAADFRTGMLLRLVYLCTRAPEDREMRMRKADMLLEARQPEEWTSHVLRLLALHGSSTAHRILLDRERTRHGTSGMRAVLHSLRAPHLIAQN